MTYNYHFEIPSQYIGDVAALQRALEQELAVDAKRIDVFCAWMMLSLEYYAPCTGWREIPVDRKQAAMLCLSYLKTYG